MLPSSFNQAEKPKKGPRHDEALFLWPGESSSKDGVVGRPIRPFDIHNRGYITKRFKNMERKGLHPLVEARRKYSEAFPDISIINLHTLDQNVSGDPILQEMFCRILDLSHSCAAVKLNSRTNIGNLQRNSYYSVSYDILATTAHAQKLFGFQSNNTKTKDTSRSAIVNRLKMHQEVDLNLRHTDFPRRCLSQRKMDRLVNASITSEQVVFWQQDGWNWTSQDEARHRQAFAEYQQEKSYVFCSIDATKVLQDPTWRAFIANI